MLRSVFSTTTMASSTTMPMARIMPNRVSMLIEKPRTSIPISAPRMDTGTARVGMMVSRRLCRKMNTTNTTSTTASKKVWITSSMEACTNLVVSNATSYCKPSGKLLDSSASVARTSFATLMAFAPGCW